MPELKIRIEKDACCDGCDCGKCGFIYEEYVEA